MAAKQRLTGEEKQTVEASRRKAMGELYALRKDFAVIVAENERLELELREAKAATIERAERHQAQLEAAREELTELKSRCESGMKLEKELMARRESAERGRDWLRDERDAAQAQVARLTRLGNAMADLAELADLSVHGGQQEINDWRSALAPTQSNLRNAAEGETGPIAYSAMSEEGQLRNAPVPAGPEVQQGEGEV